MVLPFDTVNWIESTVDCIERLVASPFPEESPCPTTTASARRRPARPGHASWRQPRRPSSSRGFGGTTIRQVAEDAEVSQETIYKTFGGKAALLKAVYDVSLAGDDEAIPLAERPEAIAVRDADEPGRRGAGLRRARAADLEPDRPAAAGAPRRPRHRRGARPSSLGRPSGNATSAARSTFGTGQQAGWLRDDITIEQAVDSVWALNSPQPRWLLLDHGWSEEQLHPVARRAHLPRRSSRQMTAQMSVGREATGPS